jgi:hypothetical protein
MVDGSPKALQEEVAAGRLVISLSSVTYTELTENARDHQRKPTADIMLKLSRLATIAPLRKVVDEELARELNRRFGRAAFPVKVPKIGHGALGPCSWQLWRAHQLFERVDDSRPRR